MKNIFENRVIDAFFILCVITNKLKTGRLTKL